MDIKQRVKNLCKQNGVSMNALEKELHLGGGYISKLGSTTPSTKKIQLIADYFHVSVDYLISGTPSDTQYVLLDENVDLVMEIVHRIHDDKGFLERMTKYIELITRGNTVIDEMIDFQYDKQKKAEN